MANPQRSGANPGTSAANTGAPSGANPGTSPGANPPGKNDQAKGRLIENGQKIAVQQLELDKLKIQNAESSKLLLKTRIIALIAIILFGIQLYHNFGLSLRVPEVIEGS